MPEEMPTEPSISAEPMEPKIETTEPPIPEESPVKPSPEPPVEPSSAPKKNSGAIWMILLAILAVLGIGFGVYAWFFRPAAELSTNCPETNCPTCPTCAESELECPECEKCTKCSESDTHTMSVNNGATGDTHVYTISIEDGNVFRIIEKIIGSAVDSEPETTSDKTYHINSMGADGLANAIRLMSKKSESGFSDATDASLMFYMLEGLTDDQFKQVLEYIADIN